MVKQLRELAKKEDGERRDLCMMAIEKIEDVAAGTISPMTNHELTQCIFGAFAMIGILRFPRANEDSL